MLTLVASDASSSVAGVGTLGADLGGLPPGTILETGLRTITHYVLDEWHPRSKLETSDCFAHCVETKLTGVLDSTYDHPYGIPLRYIPCKQQQHLQLSIQRRTLPAVSRCSNSPLSP